MEDKSYVSLSEIVYGSQTVRADGKDLIINDSETPNFSKRFENMFKVKTRTEDELKLVKEKLEKLLFSGDNNQNEAIAKPLQHKVFVSRVGLLQKTIVKDHRTSLSELFRKNKITDEKIDPIISIIRNQTEKRTDNSVKSNLKKTSTTASVGTTNPASADEKLNSILHMLQRAYPEASAISQKSQNLWKYMTNSNLAHDDINTLPCKAIPEVSHPIYGAKDNNWKKECWIKSDAEYVILELKKENDAVFGMDAMLLEYRSKLM